MQNLLPTGTFFICDETWNDNTSQPPTSSSLLLCSFCCSMRFCRSASSCFLYFSWSFSCCCCRWGSERFLFSCCSLRNSRRSVDSPGRLTMELKRRGGFYMTKHSLKEKKRGALGLFVALCYQIMICLQQLILQPHLVCYKPAWSWLLGSSLDSFPPTARKLKQQLITDILYSAVLSDSYKTVKVTKGDPGDEGFRASWESCSGWEELPSMRTAWAVHFSISVIKLTLVLLHLHSAHHLPPHFHCNHSPFLLKKKINKRQRRMLLFKTWSWTLFLSIHPELQAKEELEFKSHML